MQRVKTFESTGQAPNGRVYAGDLNAIQDAAAAINDLTQGIKTGTLDVGETGLQLSKYGAGEMQVAGAFRTTGKFTAGAAIIPKGYTTAGRTAIASGQRGPGAIVWNSEKNCLEQNVGSDGSPVWVPIGVNAFPTESYGNPQVPVWNPSADRWEPKIAPGAIMGFNSDGAVISVSSTDPNTATQILPGFTFTADGVSTYLLHFYAPYLTLVNISGGARVRGYFFLNDAAAGIALERYVGNNDTTIAAAVAEAVVTPAANSYTVAFKATKDNASLNASFGSGDGTGVNLGKMFMYVQKMT